MLQCNLLTQSRLTTYNLPTHVLHHARCTSLTATRQELNSGVTQRQHFKSFGLLTLRFTGVELLSGDYVTCALGMVKSVGAHMFLTVKQANPCLCDDLKLQPNLPKFNTGRTSHTKTVDNRCSHVLVSTQAQRHRGTEPQNCSTSQGGVHLQEVAAGRHPGHLHHHQSGQQDPPPSCAWSSAGPAHRQGSGCGRSARHRSVRTLVAQQKPTTCTHSVCDLYRVITSEIPDDHITYQTSEPSRLSLPSKYSCCRQIVPNDTSQL